MEKGNHLIKGKSVLSAQPDKSVLMTKYMGENPNYNTTQLEFIKQYKKRLINGYLKQSMSEDSILETLFITLAETLVNTTENDIINNNLTQGLEKKNARFIDSVLFSLVEILERTVGEISQIKESDPKLKNFTNYQQKMAFICEISGIESHTVIIKTLKANIYRYANKCHLNTEEIYNNIMLTKDINHGDDFNKSELSIVYTSLMMCFMRIKRIQFPLFEGDHVFFATEYYDQFMSDYVSCLKQFNPEALNEPLKSIKGAGISLVFNYKHILNKINGICNTETARLFKYPMAFRGDRVNIHDGYDDLLEDLVHKLKVRKSLLPSYGIEYHVDFIVEENSDVPAYVNGIMSYYINEIITEKGELYVIIRMSRNKHNMFIIYNPVEGELTHIDMFSDKDNDVSSDVFTLYHGLEVYSKALEFYNRNGTDTGEELVHSMGKVIRGKVIFDEMLYIPGYIRRLPEGSMSSQEAMSAAKTIGLELADNQTYVRPFNRKTGRINTERKLQKPYNITNELI